MLWSISEFELSSTARAKQERYPASSGDVFWSKTGEVDVRDVRI